MASGFNYPRGARVRRHGPVGYATYHSFRPWLRDEFGFRCVYCLVREQWGRVSGQFGLDHFRPQSLYPQLAEYPYDLPNLARLRPPGGNLRPEGIEGAYFEMRKRGALPEVY
jgi:hypothetical protein